MLYIHMHSARGTNNKKIKNKKIQSSESWKKGRGECDVLCKQNDRTMAMMETSAKLSEKPKQ